jgi:hypothetical protein
MARTDPGPQKHASGSVKELCPQYTTDTDTFQQFDWIFVNLSA